LTHFRRTRHWHHQVEFLTDDELRPFAEYKATKVDPEGRFNSCRTCPAWHDPVFDAALRSVTWGNANAEFWPDGPRVDHAQSDIGASC
jgi:hypothetical protein